MQKRDQKTHILVLTAVLTALHIVLSYTSISLGNISITFAGLPVLIGSLAMGPAAGFTIGMLGSFINQLLKYGLMPTTLLWAFPAGLMGLIAGFYAKRHQYRLTQGQISLICLLSVLAVTAVNTLVMYIDSRIYGYYSFAYIFGAVPFRIVSGILRAVLFAAIINPLIRRLPFLRVDHTGSAAMSHR